MFPGVPTYLLNMSTWIPHFLHKRTYLGLTNIGLNKKALIKNII